MTKNMERMRFEIARAIITCFPKDYIEMAFVSGVSEKEFIDWCFFRITEYEYVK